jgi:hypothetical protein
VTIDSVILEYINKQHRNVRTKYNEYKKRIWYQTLGGRDETYKMLVGKSEGKNHSEDQGVDGRIMLEWIIQKQNEKI